MRYLTKLLFCALLFFSSLGAVGYADGPYHGRVIDAQTKQPIEGAVVFAQWWTHSPGPTTVRLAQAYYDSQETLTDRQGNFVIAGIMHPPAPPATLDPPTFIIFKPGYEVYGGWSIKAKRLPGTIRLYEKDGVTVVELGRLTTREKRLENLRKIFIPSDVPEKKYPNLISYRNAERVNLGMKPY